jgi:glutamate-5-semialdehyde dehydrogenase
MSQPLHALVGDKIVELPPSEPGQKLLGVTELSELLVISESAQRAAREAVSRAGSALEGLRRASDASISAFFEAFADRLEDPQSFEPIAAANARDVESAQARGRATGRLRLTDSMRRAMIEGLRGWAKAPSRVGELVERREGDGFSIERRRAPLGLVAFVFEGRPNVFSDAAGVLRNRNAAVFRIGGDALGTAIAIEENALRPSLASASLPLAALTLVRSAEHGAAQALFCERSVRLAVARGSGRTVALLGAVARQHGIPVSLHGTGGAWMYVEPSASPEALHSAIVNSLDRKVCNTLNVLLLDRAAQPKLGSVVEAALRQAQARVYVARGSEGCVTAERAIETSELSHEWEWDQTPEVSFALVDGLTQAAELFNAHSPRFVASILSTRPGAFEAWADAVEAPYVSNAFTRWVDGQWAWLRPELGLTNWETGRLLGRSGFLSGDDITTMRDFFIDHTGLAPQRR